MSDDDSRITSIVADRIRLAVTIELIGITAGLCLSEPIGIPIPASVFALNLVMLAFLAAVRITIQRDKLPTRYIHLAAMCVWLAPAVNTLASFMIIGDPNLVFPLLIEIALAPIVQLSLRYLYASMGGVVAVYIVLELTVWTSASLMHITTILGLLVACVMIGRNIRRSLATAIVRDDERERIRDQFVHAQRLDAVGTLAAGLAHDMNNILSGILGIAEIASMDTEDVALRRDLVQITRETSRASDLLRSLLTYSRRDRANNKLVAVDTIVDEIEPLLARMLSKQITLERRGGSDVVLEADAAQIGQALVNLCINSADAMTGAGMLSITTAAVTLDATRAARLALPPGSYAAITVRDTGCGMDEATRLRIFEPFFTTKPVGQGTGLGLAMVHGTVKAHGGAVDVESAPGKGAAFTLYLPAAKTAVPRALIPRATGRHAPSPMRLALVVDDEPTVRATTTRILRNMGISVVAASDGAEALEVFAARRREISIVVLDMVMPVMGGAECLREIRSKSGVPVVIATAHHGEPIDEQANTVVLEKPFTADAMRDEVERLLEQGRASPSP